MPRYGLQLEYTHTVKDPSLKQQALCCCNNFPSSCFRLFSTFQNQGAWIYLHLTTRASAKSTICHVWTIKPGSKSLFISCSFIPNAFLVNLCTPSKRGMYPCLCLCFFLVGSFFNNFSFQFVLPVNYLIPHTFMFLQNVLALRNQYCNKCSSISLCSQV